MTILSSSSHTKHPASLANPSDMKLTTRSLHSQKSSSSFGCLSCITVRRDDLKERAGIKLQQDSKTGEITVSSISEKGLFKDTALEVGDLVLSVNKQRLKKGEGPEVLMDIVRNNKTISIAIKKPAKDKTVGTPLSSKSSRKKNKSKHGSSSSSTHNRKERPSKLEKPSRNSSNSTDVTADTSLSLYDGGLSQHNADGSVKIEKNSNDEKVEKEPLTKTLTISACKPGAPINVAGKSARRLSSSKPHHTRSSIQSSSRRTSHSHSDNNNQIPPHPKQHSIILKEDKPQRQQQQSHRTRSSIQSSSRRTSHSDNNNSSSSNNIRSHGSMHRRRSKRTSHGSTGNLIVSGKSSRGLILEQSQHESSKRDSSYDSKGSLFVAGKSSRRLSLSKSQHNGSIHRRLSGSSHLSGGSHGTISSSKHQRKRRVSTRSSKTTHNRTSTSKKSNEACVGLKLKVVNKQLEVVEIREDSIFKGTELNVGDKILSINDMSFRRYADAEYAFTLMDKASLLVTLVVEREDNDDTASTDDDDDSSFSSFCNDDQDYHNASSASKTTEVEGTDFNAPFTITVSKAFVRQDAGLTFKQTHRSSKKNTRVVVEKIARNSIFRNTALQKGDRVLMINNTDLRSNPDTNLAYDTCMESNESIVMLVLRKESDPRSASNKEISFSSGDWNIEL